MFGVPREGQSFLVTMIVIGAVATVLRGFAARRLRGAVALASPRGGRISPRGPRTGARSPGSVWRWVPALIRPGADAPRRLLCFACEECCAGDDPRTSAMHDMR
jgi:hypothetical protein